MFVSEKIYHTNLRWTAFGWLLLAPAGSVQWRSQPFPLGTRSLAGSGKSRNFVTFLMLAEGGWKPYSSRMEVRVTPETTMESSMSVVEAFRATLGLFQTGVDLMRQNLRRRHPEARGEDIERRLGEWLRERPGAESGDCPGRPMKVRPDWRDRA